MVKPHCRLRRHRGASSGADYYSVHVIDRVGREVAAVMHGHFNAYQFAWYLFVLGFFYEKSHDRLRVSTNGH
jgi:hypothetical protein